MSADKTAIVQNNIFVKYVNHDIDGAYPFIYVINTKKVFFGNCGQTHGDILRSQEYCWSLSSANQGKIHKLHGRIWTNEKIISFWDYDFADFVDVQKGDEITHESISKFNDLTFRETLELIQNTFNDIVDNAKELEFYSDNLHEKILKEKIDFNDNWLIDIPVLWSNEYDNNYVAYRLKYSLITLDKFEKVGLKNIDTKGSEEARAIHLLSYAEKQALKKKGWGRGWVLT